jgi:hypothetical protein
MMMTMTTATTFSKATTTTTTTTTTATISNSTPRFQDDNRSSSSRSIRPIHNSTNNNSDAARRSSASSSYGNDDNDDDTTAAKSNNNNWHPLLYMNPWESQHRQGSLSHHSFFLQPLVGGGGGDDDDASSSSSSSAIVQSVDLASRHLIQLLQEVYHYNGHANVRSSAGSSSSSSRGRHGGVAGADHVPLSRCHVVLQRLVELPFSVHGRAQRADAILILLQLMDEKQQQQQQLQLQRGGGGGDSAALHHHHHQRSPFAPLRPNHATYRIVLQLYATTTTTGTLSTTHDDDDDDESTFMAVPLRAQELIQQMQDGYQIRGNLQMKPHAYHYNRVLYCWKECRHATNRILYATQFFLHNVHHNDGSLDATSYVIMMRICSGNLSSDHHHQPQQQQQRGHDPRRSSQHQVVATAAMEVAILGAKAAIRIWQATMEQQQQQQQQQPSLQSPASSPPPQQVDLPSHFYTHFLQAIRPLSDQTGGPKDFELRKEYFAKCFVHAQRHGKLNAHILQEFIVHVQSQRLTRQLLGDDLMDAIYGVSPTTRAVQVLLEKMPSSWKEHATN